MTGLAFAADPFQVRFPDEALDDLRSRLDRTRWPAGSLGLTWQYGTRQADLEDLIEHWRSHFDWRAQETAINNVPQFTVSVLGTRLHFLVVEGRGPAPLPLLVSHGWPSSFVEILPLIPRLTDPIAFGGDPADSFTVVVPSLPGFGFSEPVYDPNFIISDLLSSLMRDVLGFKRFGTQAGDIGARVTAQLARRNPELLIGMHLHSDWADTGVPWFGEVEEEAAFLERDGAWETEEDGYGHIQGTKPQTLGYGLVDSPVGLAAWILEKFHAWADVGDDVFGSFGRDELLTNITLYWLTNTITTSFLPYYNGRHRTISTPRGRIEVPTGIARLPGDDPQPPGREAAERLFDLRQWTDMPRGGHFAGMEVPDLLSEDVASFFRPLR
jgi:pimeloyl-ACP methyl ester carboxylesterase